MDINPAGEGGKAAVTLSTFDNAPVYYTTDGTEPTAASPLYKDPIVLDGNTVTVKAKAIRDGRESNTVEETLQYNLATMRPIQLACTPDPNYTYKGANLLVDGLKGDDNYRSGRYIGIYGENLDATIDLQEEKEISAVTIGTYLVPGDYIFGLTGIEVYVSADGKAPFRYWRKAVRTMSWNARKSSSTRLLPAMYASSVRILRFFRNGIPAQARKPICSWMK